MGLVDKITDLAKAIDDIKADAQALEGAQTGATDTPAQTPTQDAPAPAGPSAEAMEALEGQIKALGDERDAKAKEVERLREVIKAHIEDEKTDTTKLEKDMEPIEEVPVIAPVPEVPKVEDAPKADEPKTDPVTGQAKPQDLIDVANPGGTVEK